MTRFVALCIALVASLAACAGDFDPADSSDPATVGTLEHSVRVYTIANKFILKSRPQATQLLVDQVNMVLANNNILQTVVKDVERRVLSPLTDGKPTNTCPYLTKTVKTTTLNCRFLVDRAVEDSLVTSTQLKETIEQDVDKSHGHELKVAEVAFVKGWANEALLSGIDVGAVHAVELLREKQACDQAPPVNESAFKLGEGQGKALLESTEAASLPAIPRTICNTDTVAATILAEAKSKLTSFKSANPICAGYASSDLAEAVDLSQAEKNRTAGLDEGLRQAHEALRVRLVSSWVCIQPAPPTGDPLVLDLEGQGVAFSGRRAAFDLAATGEPVLVPVLASSAALLALDLDGNGRIDTGAELMSNATRCGAHRCTDGIEALAQYDANHDGVIDARDAVYARLVLWRDANGDGQATADELRTLAAAGVTAIALGARLDRAFADSQGNSSLRSLSFTRRDGSSGTAYDVWYSLSFSRTPADPRTTGMTSSLRARAR